MDNRRKATALMGLKNCTYFNIQYSLLGVLLNFLINRSTDQQINKSTNHKLKNSHARLLRVMGVFRFN